jgi:hypothetical protein
MTLKLRRRPVHAGERLLWTTLWVAMSTLVVVCATPQLNRTARHARCSTLRLGPDTGSHDDTRFADGAREAAWAFHPPRADGDASDDGHPRLTAMLAGPRPTPDGRGRDVPLPLLTGAFEAPAAFHEDGRGPPLSQPIAIPAPASLPVSFATTRTRAGVPGICSSADVIFFVLMSV